MTVISTRRIVLGVALCLFVAASGFAQYGGGVPGMGTPGAGGGVYTPPKGGYKSSTGIAIGGAAAAGIAVTYLMLRSRKSVVGCVSESAAGTELRDTKGQTYVLDAPNISLKMGDRVKLSGRKTKSDTGAPGFAARKLVKDYGPCGTQTAMAHSSRWHI